MTSEVVTSEVVVTEDVPKTNDPVWDTLDGIGYQFEEVYLEQLKESLSIGEQLIIELEGFIEVDAFEFKVKGYKLNQKTNKIELIIE